MKIIIEGDKRKLDTFLRFNRVWMKMNGLTVKNSANKDVDVEKILAPKKKPEVKKVSPNKKQSEKK